MLEATITKAVVLEDEKDGKTVLMGVAEYFGECLNFKVKYEWDTLDKDWFLKELRETIAKEFDLAVKQVDVKAASLFQKMQQYHIWNKESKA